MEYSDFCKPNPVLLYGCGGFFQFVAPYLLNMKINISGVIDINKKGMIKVKDIEIPIYNIDEAVNKFGNDLCIIITLQNISLINEVKHNLIEHGFNKDKIFDVNQIMWLTVPSEKSFCQFLGRDIYLHNMFIKMCCTTSNNNSFNAIPHFFIEEENEDNVVNMLLNKYKFYRQQSLNGYIPLFCMNCPMLSEDKSIWSDVIQTCAFNDHTYCNSDCVYCCEGISNKRNEKILLNYDKRCRIFSKIIAEIKHRDLINEKTSLALGGGEITISPNKNLLYNIVRDMSDNPIMIFTNGFIYDEEILNILSTCDNSVIMCDLDAGTRITYIKVKGFDKFNIVQGNLKQYGNPKKIILKYVIKPGWNDTDEDILGTVDLLKFLNIETLFISPDFNFIKSHFNQKEIKRILVFSVSKFKVILEKNGLKLLITNFYWQEEYIIEINRMANELKSAGYVIK